MNLLDFISEEVEKYLDREEIFDRRCPEDYGYIRQCCNNCFKCWLLPVEYFDKED